MRGPDPFSVVRQFESAVASYTGAPYCVAVTSCTTALMIACAWFRVSGYDGAVSIPARTYVGVPASILNAGLKVVFRDEEWEGEYKLKPLPLWDSARWFTRGMYRRGRVQCTSHHWSKTLGISQGGCILHDDEEADAWMRRARFDGRTEGVPAGEDQIQYPSWHAYMTPAVAAEGLTRLAMLPEDNLPLPADDYPDLSKMGAFK